MSFKVFFTRTWRSERSLQAIASLLALFLFLQPALVLTSNAEGRSQRTKKQGMMTEDQRIAHALSRLTFGARSGDFEKVKAMGVDAFIAQQLDPDSIDAGTVIAKLKRLPTLGMATPVIIEQYTPPKPAVVPSPVPAKSPDNVPSLSQKMIAQNPLSQTPQITTNTRNAAMHNEMQMEAKKSAAATMPAPSAASQNNAAAQPKPTPPPRNPYM